MGEKNPKKPKTTGANLRKKIKRRRFKESFNRALEQDQLKTNVQTTILIFPLWGEKKHQ